MFFFVVRKPNIWSFCSQSFGGTSRDFIHLQVVEFSQKLPFPKSILLGGKWPCKGNENSDGMETWGDPMRPFWKDENIMRIVGWSNLPVKPNKGPTPAGRQRDRTINWELISKAILKSLEKTPPSPVSRDSHFVLLQYWVCATQVFPAYHQSVSVMRLMDQIFWTTTKMHHFYCWYLQCSNPANWSSFVFSNWQ